MHVQEGEKVPVFVPQKYAALCRSSEVYKAICACVDRVHTSPWSMEDP